MGYIYPLDRPNIRNARVRREGHFLSEDEGIRSPNLRHAKDDRGKDRELMSGLVVQSREVGF
jgi:hypothetical protein